MEGVGIRNHYNVVINKQFRDNASKITYVALDVVKYSLCPEIGAVLVRAYNTFKTFGPLTRAKLCIGHALINHCIVRNGGSSH